MSEEIAQAAADVPMIAQQATEIADLQRRLAIAEAAETYWRQQHADIWVLIGRVDFALEQTVNARGIRDARTWAARARAAIKAGSSPRTAKEAVL